MSNEEKDALQAEDSNEVAEGATAERSEEQLENVSGGGVFMKRCMACGAPLHGVNLRCPKCGNMPR